MMLSTSRQQFLAYESQTPEDLQYGRKGGIFVSYCICISFIVFAVIVAVIVGVIVHFITYFKLSHNTVDYWDETEPFGQKGPPPPNLRLPSDVVPSFYRLKLKVNLDNSTFSGDVYITIRVSRAVREIILHSKNLSISNNAKLTEQIYETLETLHMSKAKRDVSAVNVTELIQNVTTIAPSTTENINVSMSTNTVPQSTNTMQTVSTTTQFTPVSLDTQVTHSSVRSIRILSIDKGTGDRLILLLESSLKRGVDYILQLSFEGAISNSLTGFYKSSYTNSKQEVKNLAVTQFEPTSARTAFPCFDEPAFKAKFEISIAHQENVKALSNMKTSMEEPIVDQPGWQWTHFDRSVRMSTYLVAYVLTDFESLETSYVSKDNISKAVRVWTRPEWISKAKYALDITPKLLAYYEEVFGIPYVLEKLDLIAIPDFSSGAMENWGLITFRETALLLHETESTPRDRQTVAIDVAHELAHQWFGNLVTMRWWTDLWLNEGFATYIEYVGVNRIAPEWEMFESFSRDKMDLLRTDALKNTSPVSRKVVDACEISQKFDEISYNKGANLIRMLNNTITEELFHKGLLTYLNDWKYSNAEETDLWQAMSKATQSEPGYKDLSVVDFMNTWTKQAGYPVVSVTRNYETGAVVFEQRLFTTAKDPYQKMINQLWHIPISYAIMGTSPSSWSTKPQTWLRDRFSVINIPVNETQALYVNVEGVGYYRVNYDQKNWQLLSEALKMGQIKSPITKSQLLDDAFNFAKISQLNYSYALGLTTCVINGEDSKMVWDQLLNNMVFLRYNLKSTAGYIYFQDYMKIILKTQLKKVNYGLDKPRDDNEAFLIENLVMWECYVESPRCLRWAREQFDNWTRQADLSNNPIPSYLRSLVYNMVVRYGGRSEFEFLWNVFLNSSDPGVKSLIINNLPATRDESLITLLLERSLSELPKQYAVAAWSVEPPMGTRVAQDFLVENFERVYGTFTEIDSFMFPIVLGGAFGFIATDEELDRLKALALKHKDKLQPMSQVLQKLVDTAVLRIDWARKHAAGISAWFKEYLTNTSHEINISDTTSSATRAQNSTTADDVTTPPAVSNTTAPTTLNTTSKLVTG